MATEEQTQGSDRVRFAGGTNWDRVGQKLTISDRVVSKLSFKTKKVGSPTGTITMTIRRVSDDSVIATKEWGSAANVSTSAEWIEVTFDSAVYVNEEVRILMEWSGDLGDGNNYLEFWATNTSVKANELVTRYYGGYTDTDSWDATYIYTYEAGVAPTVTIQAVTNIVTTTARGHGEVTGLGNTDVTEHGHCWSTTSPPTTADSKTTLGAKSAIGTFVSELTGLTEAQTYYIRAYATNGFGVSYSSELTFVAGTAGAQSYPTQAITRVTNLIHRYNRKEGTYTLELALGEVTSDFGLPQWLSSPQHSTAEQDVQQKEKETAKSPAVKASIQVAIDEVILDPRLVAAQAELDLAETRRVEEMKQADPRLWAAAEELRSRREAQQREIDQMLARDVEIKKRTEPKLTPFKEWIKAGRPGPYSEWLKKSMPRAPLASEVLTEEQRKLFGGL